MIPGRATPSGSTGSRTLNGSDGSGAPRVALLLPIVMALHVAEEWFADFPGWTGTVFGNGVSVERFVILNSVGLVVFTVGTLAAVGSAGGAWFVVAFASLLVLNGFAHALLTLVFGLYSPGTITGLLLSIPVGIAVLRASRPRLS